MPHAARQLPAWLIFDVRQRMKIDGEFTITGRGHGILTDEPFTPTKFAAVRAKKTIRVAAEGRLVELDIQSAEIALKSGGREFLAFLVPDIKDAATREFIVGRDIELV
jgi:hypothetical protein